MPRRDEDHRDGGLDDGALIHALNHPLRRALLLLFLDDERQLSPLEASKALDSPLPTVSYHVRTLLKCGAITLVHTQPRRGTIQHFYVASEEVRQAAWIRDALSPDDSTAAA